MKKSDQLGIIHDFPNHIPILLYLSMAMRKWKTLFNNLIMMIDCTFARYFSSILKTRRFPGIFEPCCHPSNIASLSSYLLLLLFFIFIFVEASIWKSFPSSGTCNKSNSYMFHFNWASQIGRITLHVKNIYVLFSTHSSNYIYLE